MSYRTDCRLHNRQSALYGAYTTRQVIGARPIRSRYLSVRASVDVDVSVRDPQVGHEAAMLIVDVATKDDVITIPAVRSPEGREQMRDLVTEVIERTP